MTKTVLTIGLLSLFGLLGSQCDSPIPGLDRIGHLRATRAARYPVPDGSVRAS